jgi:molybdopterin synthase catalytic subunit
MITVKLFAILKEKAGNGELQISGNFPAVSDLLAHLSKEYPGTADMLSRGCVLISINHEFVESSAPLRDGDEVALMPPFSGGDERARRIRIQQDPFDLNEEIARLKAVSSSIGAIVTFLGTTRDLSKGRHVAKLDFEHYPGMAEKKLAEIRERAIKEYGVIEVTIVHRVGTMPVGEDIVLIAVASGHRDEAFRACRFCIDELKRITPIWKKETTPEGEVWVEEHP